MSETKRPIAWVKCTECNTDSPVDPWRPGPKCPHCGAADAFTSIGDPDEDPIVVPAAVFAALIAHAPIIPSNGGIPVAVAVAAAVPPELAIAEESDGEAGGEVVELHHLPAPLAPIDGKDREGNPVYRGYTLRIPSQIEEVRMVYSDVLAGSIRIRKGDTDRALANARMMIDGWYPQPGTAPGELPPPSPGRRRR